MSKPYCETCGAIKKDFCCCSTFKLFKTKSESPLGCEIKVPWYDDELSSLKQENQRFKEQLEEAVEILKMYGDPFYYLKNYKKGPYVDDFRVVPASDCEKLAGGDMINKGQVLIGAGKRARQFLKKYRGEK